MAINGSGFLFCACAGDIYGDRRMGITDYTKRTKYIKPAIDASGNLQRCILSRFLVEGSEEFDGEHDIYWTT